MEITGHLEAFDLKSGWIDITTCPEWPPKRHRVYFQEESAIRGLAVFQLVRVEAREEQGRLIGVSVKPAGPRQSTEGKEESWG